MELPPTWPEQEGDMALIRRVNALMQMASASPGSAGAPAALAEAATLMPAYAAATRRFNAATRQAMAPHTITGAAGEH